MNEYDEVKGVTFETDGSIYLFPTGVKGTPTEGPPRVENRRIKGNGDGSTYIFPPGAETGTPTPTPSPTPAPIPSGDYEMRTVNNLGAGEPHFQGEVGKTYCMEVACVAGKTGSYEAGPVPGTPTEMDIELALSLKPGDMAWSRSPAAAVIIPASGRGEERTEYPAYKKEGLSQSTSIRWNVTGSLGVAPVPTGRCFLNVRMVPNAAVSEGTPVTFVGIYRQG